MRRILKALVVETPFYHILRNRLVRRRHDRELRDWLSKGKPVPPPHKVKQEVLREYALRYNLRILVETGTHYGDMVEALKRHFTRIYSIELSRQLFEKSKKRFKADNHIELIHGDSSKELGCIMRKLDQPALFWLDGHYSGGITAQGEKDTPIYEELEHIFNASHLRHVVIIDDARCFGSDPAYPMMEDLKNYVFSKRSNTRIEIENDIIRIIPS